jgi:hypothetical protein
LSGGRPPLLEFGLCKRVCAAHHRTVDAYFDLWGGVLMRKSPKQFHALEDERVSNRYNSADNNICSMFG